MILLGITGGFGTGKSTVGRILVEFGLNVVDTDDVAREVVKPGEPALEEIKHVFGHEFIKPDGTLDRTRMAQLVFNNPLEKKRLEEILHPRIRLRWKQVVSEWEKAGFTACAVVIPLLFETGAEKEFNKIICVACSPELQRQRLLSKGWAAEDIEKRIASQMSIEEKIKLSDYVLWNDAGIDVLKEQVVLILNELGINPGT